MPLRDLFVVEFASILAGPLVGQFCAELGADVVKVESPRGGDATRGWHLSVEDPQDDRPAYFCCANWGKRSIAADLTSEHGKQLAHRLVRRADVVIVSFRPGVEARLGLDYKTLSALNPRLIYVQVTAYGSDDKRPGFDAILQAEGGFTFLNGEPKDAPTKMPVALVDVLASHHLKQGLLLALLRRATSDRGSYVSTSLLGAATASLANQASNFLMAGVVPQRMGSEHPNIVPYGKIFPTSEGQELVLAVGTDGQFTSLCRTLALDAAIDDPRYATNALRVEHREALNALLTEAVGQRSGPELSQALIEARVPFGFVNDMRQVFEQEISRRQCFEGMKGVRTVALEGDIEGRRQLSMPPRLDQHGDEIRDQLDRV